MAKKNNAKKIIIGVVIIALIATFVVVGVVKNSGSVGSGPVFSVQTAKVTKGDINSYISANGTVTEVEKNEVYLDTPVKVTKLYVKQNEAVKNGQKIADFDLDSLNTQLQQQKLTLATQQLGLKKVGVMDTTVSITANQNALKTAENALVSSQSNYDDSLKSYNDTKTLYDVGAASKSDLDRALKTLNDAKIALENAKLNVDTQKASISQTSKTNSQSVSSKSLDIQTQEIAIKTTQLNITDLENKIKKYNEAMYSKMDGIMSQVNVVEGGFTPSMQPAFTVINPDKLEVKLNINEYNAKMVKPGQRVEISGDSIPENEKISGKVSSVSPIANKNSTNSGSVETVIEVKVAIDNISDSIKPGISVNCDIMTVDIKNVLTLDLDMLKQDKDGNKSVFIVDKDKKIMKEKKITIGTSSDMKAEIKDSSLKEGDLIVLSPQPSYKDGSRIKLAAESANSTNSKD